MILFVFLPLSDFFIAAAQATGKVWSWPPRLPRYPAHTPLFPSPDTSVCIETQLDRLFRSFFRVWKRLFKNTLQLNNTKPIYSTDITCFFGFSLLQLKNKGFCVDFKLPLYSLLTQTSHLDLFIHKKAPSENSSPFIRMPAHWLQNKG